jgi:hypothetical protein
MTTPNMALTLPVVSQTPGPTWASEINADLSLIDSHNHTSGNGALVPVAGLDINADLSLDTHALTDVTKVVLLNGASATSNSVYAVAGNLWWTNGGGTPVQITSGNAVNVGGSGSIGGMILNCAVVYSSGLLSYAFFDETGAKASLICDSISLDQTVLSPSGSVSLTLPSTVPAGNSFVVGSSTGATSATLSLVSQTGYVTKDMQAPATISIQSPQTSLSAVTSSFTDLTNPITITTSGRPVFIGVMGGNSLSSSFELEPGSPSTTGQIGAFLQFDIQTGASPSFQTNINSFSAVAVNGTDDFNIPLSSMSCVVALPAGTHVIKLQGRYITGGLYQQATITAVFARIYAYEL